ncbi:MAG: phosphoribosylaminoimidazolesuccinocarboxamide synthase [Candidatus Limnocylindrales bacterium]
MLTADRFLRSGKVRDLYQRPDGRLLLVASDRISAFDVVLPTVIPDKGRVLTGLSRFWFAQTAGIVPNHLLSTDAAGDPDLRGRIMVCRPTEVIPIEAVVRGYLAGSGWKEYRATGAVCGNVLPSGLRESERLPEPIFTPATKAEQGEHDENIDLDAMVARSSVARRPSGCATSPFACTRMPRGSSADAGLILADTKFEFGLDRATGELLLIDEVLTPDSSRFWDAASYEPGRAQASFDKQFVRDWLETQPWDKTAPGPALPDRRRRRARASDTCKPSSGSPARSFERYLAEDVIAR